jgi:hypothetical protein
MTLNPLRLATEGFFTSLAAGENTLNPATLNAITGAVWDVLNSDHLAAGSTGASLATTLALVQAFTLGRFKIDYEASTATQYRPDGTVLKVFNLRDKDGNPAIVAQTAVDRVPQP